MNPLESWHEEQRSAYLYRVCAEAESDGTRAELFRRLAGEAEAQAAIWRAQVTARGHAPPAPYEPDGRTRLVAAAGEAPRPAAHARRAGRDEGPRHVDLRHRDAARRRAMRRRRRRRASSGGIAAWRGGGNLRAAVFGVNDGLVSNASLILGVAGASADPQRRAAVRYRGHVRRRVRDGRGRVRLGALAARALRAPDRTRARRAEAIPGGRGAGARAHLRGEGAAAQGSHAARAADHRRSRARARHARARGARPQSGRARIAVGRGDLVVPVVCRGSAAAAGAVHPGAGSARAADRDRDHRR